MKKWVLYGILGVIAMAAIGAFLPSPPPGTRQEPPIATPTPAPAPTPATWTTVATWSGKGMKTTESFTTTTTEWRIRWASTAEPFPGAGILQVYVYSGTGSLVQLAANLQGVGQDTSYVRAPAGTFYLTINSANVTYSVTVEERR